LERQRIERSGSRSHETGICASWELAVKIVADKIALLSYEKRGVLMLISESPNSVAMDAPFPRLRFVGDDLA
jgi:hypothetical protein